MLLCVYFRPAKSSPNCTAIRTITWTTCWSLLLLQGSRGSLQRAACCHRYTLLLGALLTLTLGSPGDDPAPVMVVPHHWSEGPPWHGHAAPEQRVCGSRSRELLLSPQNRDMVLGNQPDENDQELLVVWQEFVDAGGSNDWLACVMWLLRSIVQRHDNVPHFSQRCQQFVLFLLEGGCDHGGLYDYSSCCGTDNENSSGSDYSQPVATPLVLLTSTRRVYSYLVHIWSTSSHF